MKQAVDRVSNMFEENAEEDAVRKEKEGTTWKAKEKAEEEATKITLPLNPPSRNGESLPPFPEEHNPLSPREKLKVAMCLARTYLSRSKIPPPSSTDRELAQKAGEIIKQSINMEIHDDDTKADHNNMLEWLWDLYEGLDNTGRAEDTVAHLNSIKNRLELCRDLLRRYLKDNRLVSKALSLLKEGNHDMIHYKLLSKNILTEYDSPSVLRTLLHQYASNSLFHERFCQAFRRDPVFVQRAYAEARIHDGGELETCTHIRYYYGVVLFAQGKVDEAVFLWKENVPYEEFSSIAAAKTDQCVEFEDRVTNQVLGKMSMHREDERRRLLDCQIKTAERLASAYIGLARKEREKAVKEKYARKIKKCNN